MKTKRSAAPTALKPTNNVPATRSTPVIPATAPTAAKPAVAAAPATAVRPAAGATPATAPTPATAAKPATVATAKPAPSGALTTIDVKMDVGLGNAIFLRGEGSGLTWDRGVPLVCVDGGTWRWSQTVSAPITFKLLLNDKVWSAGNDLVIKPGQNLQVAPSFA